ncbi:MAG: hypothetical protein GEV28_09165 [Actinophytocola sp.]|uniref:ESX secretion-associated protein EspG n=1 Tax=Actinophytocola sp. TaxID=1872138 RepID=UPI0013214650|nr:ESX secretion-associated protein EspG [Actinophytocola sp.]MPZ80544.1 hypothetical protein [Actinophytocola sp.]
MARSFSLSLAAADIVAQLLGVNIRLFPFDIPSVGQLQQDRTRIARAVFADLARRGLVRHGDLDPELGLALRTLSDHVITVAVMGTVETHREIYARASASGDTGVLAVKEAQSLRLELIRPTALALSLVGLLPRAQAGPGQSVTISRQVPAPGRHRRADDDERELFTRVQPTQGASAQQLRIAESYLSRPRTGTGFFAVSGRDRMGREVRAGGLTWLDTDAGRYLTLSRPADEEGTVRSTFSPADNSRLTQQLGEMIESVAPRA